MWLFYSLTYCMTMNKKLLLLTLPAVLILGGCFGSKTTTEQPQDTSLS